MVSAREGHNITNYNKSRFELNDTVNPIMFLLPQLPPGNKIPTGTQASQVKETII
jgi:hypothetical protein